MSKSIDLLFALFSLGFLCVMKTSVSMDSLLFCQTQPANDALNRKWKLGRQKQQAMPIIIHPAGAGVTSRCHCTRWLATHTDYPPPKPKAGLRV